MPIHHDMSQPLPWDTGVMSRRRSSTGSRRNSLLSVSLFDFPLTPGAQRDLVNSSGFPYDSSDPFAPLSLGDPLMSSSMALATSHLLASPRRPQRPSVTDRLLGDRSEDSIPTVISAGSHNNNNNNNDTSSNSPNNINTNNNYQHLFGNNNNGMYNINTNINNMNNNTGQMPLPGNVQASLNPMDQLHLQRHNNAITPPSSNNTSINAGLSLVNNMMYNKERMGSITGSTTADAAHSFNQQPAAAVKSLMMGSPDGQQQQQPQAPCQLNKKNTTSPATKKKGNSTDDDDEDDEDDELNQHRFKPFHEEKWSLRYKELLDFHKLHGHAAVPHTYPANPQLARWVKRQRRQYKLRQDNRQSTMTSERLEMLDSVGFVWDSHDVNWREKLDSLVAFRQEHGHCNVPSNYRNKKLATWVKCQRRQYKLYWDGKPSAMTPDRILELEKVGFEWEIRSTVPRKQAAAAKLKQQLKAQVVATMATPQTPISTVKPTPQQQQDFHLLYQNLTDL